MHSNDKTFVTHNKEVKKDADNHKWRIFIIFSIYQMLIIIIIIIIIIITWRYSPT
jgi:hypothetical protein